MNSNLKHNNEYRNWLVDIKTRIKQTQIKAAFKVNVELIRLYWDLGAEIVEKQLKSKWGDTVIRQLSLDLKEEFPNLEGFSRTNLHYMRQWYLFYNQQNTIVQQAVGQLPTTVNATVQQAVGQLPNEAHPITQQLVAQIPWGHNLLIITKCKSIEEATFYINKTIQNGWSRSMLAHHIELNLYGREGKAITNFSATLPAPQSDLAIQTLKRS